MKTVELTTAQSELLFEVAGAHLEWYKQFYIEVPSFDILLELNATKLSYFFNEKDITINDITKILLNMKKEYKDRIKLNNSSIIE